MKLFDQVTGITPEFVLTRNGAGVDVWFHYDLWGWENEEEGFYVFEGSASVSVGDDYGSASQSYGGDMPLYIDFYASLASGVTYENYYTVSDYGDGTELVFNFNTTLFTSKAKFIGTEAVDVIFGSTEDDSLSGGDGDDFIEGDHGNDTLDGGAGSDTLYGGTGNDTYIVDDIGDRVVEEMDAGTDLVKSSISYTLGENVERLTLIGSLSINATGNSGDNRLTGNSRNNILDGKEGADTMIGGKGNDTYIVDNVNDKVSEKSGEGTDHVKASVSYELTANVEKLTLTGTADISGFGNVGANELTGNAGANVLDGDAGNDRLNGGAGNDILIGGAGNDTLDGGTGVDRLYGGSGSDTYVVDNAKDRVFEDAGGGKDKVLTSTSFALAAGAEIEALATTSSRGTNAIKLTGNEFAQTITGNAGANVLSGKGGNDTLYGKDGDDRLYGGSGADKLYGGAGADTFIFKSYKDSTLSVRDMIYDFKYSEGDQIDLSAIDARSSTSVNDAFTFIGERAFTKKAGELRYAHKNDDTYIYGDVNGDGKADLSIRVDKTIDFIKSDFLL